jgi:hypothetical protein
LRKGRWVLERVASICSARWFCRMKPSCTLPRSQALHGAERRSAPLLCQTWKHGTWQTAKRSSAHVLSQQDLKTSSFASELNKGP